MKSVLVSLVVALTVVVAAMGRVEADALRTVIDQMQPIGDAAAGALAIGGDSNQQLAQVITSGVDGELVAVLLPIGCASGRLKIEIRETDGDAPGTAVLQRVKFAAADMPPIAGGRLLFRRFPLSGSLSFKAGDRFALVLRNPTGSCGMALGPEVDSYAGGEGFVDARPNRPGWVPLRLDLPFMTLMRLPVTP